MLCKYLKNKFVVFILFRSVLFGVNTPVAWSLQFEVHTFSLISILNSALLSSDQKAFSVKLLVSACLYFTVTKQKIHKFNLIDMKRVQTDEEIR